MKENMILTLKPLSSEGNYIPRETYDVYKKFIIDALEKSGGLTLIELIDQAKSCSVLKSNRDLTWTLLQVKMDLQARDRIRIKILPSRKQVIYLRKTQRKMKVENPEVRTDDVHQHGV